MAKNIILSNKIYLPYTEELFLKLHKELTYTFPGRTPKSPTETITTLTSVGQNVLLIPLGRMDLMPNDIPIKDNRVLPPAVIPKPTFTLRPAQQEFVDLIDEDNTNYICNAKPGWGKSYTALGLAYKLQTKTLIVVHTLKLRKQWVDDIRKVFGFEPGIIGSGKFETNAPIVVSNVQTLSKHADKYHKMFGLVVLDECHHTPATTFTKIIGSTKAKYRIGMTATIARRDQKQILTLDYFGKHNIYKPTQENTINPKVILYPSKHKIPGNKMTPWAIRMNQLTEDASYQAEIINLVNALVERGRRILIVSDRIAFLETCAANTNKSVCITGATEEHVEYLELMRSGEKLALYGTLSLFKEGISEDYLDTLVLANPIASEPLLEQVVGRVMRKYEGKGIPEVYDICLKGFTAQNQLATRMTFYLREDYKVVEF